MDRSDSKSKVQNFSDNGSNKSEKSVPTIDFIDFLPGCHWFPGQNSHFGINYATLFLIWRRNCRRNDYSIVVSGTFICFFIELSKPIFDFRFFSDFLVVFYQKIAL